MKATLFDTLIKELFTPILTTPLGFSCERSQLCTFYREVSDGCFHIIMPDPLSSGSTYDIKVFPYHSSLDPRRFKIKFPDEIGAPTGNFCYLSENGVGMDQELFYCKHESVLRRNFQKVVGLILKNRAVAFLDQFHTLDDMLPCLQNPLDKAIAVYYTNGLEQARQLLSEQKDRLSSFRSPDENITSMIQYLDKLLLLS